MSARTGAYPPLYTNAFIAIGFALGLTLTSHAVAYSYVTVGFGQANGGEWTSQVGMNDVNNATQAIRHADTDAAYSLSAGYMLTAHYGIEANISNLGSYSRQTSNTYRTAKVRAYGADALARFSVLNQFDVIGRAGLAYTHTQEQLSGGVSFTEQLKDITPHYAIGVEYTLLPRLHLFTEYQVHQMKQASQQSAHIKTTHIGLRWSF